MIRSLLSLLVAALSVVLLAFVPVDMRAQLLPLLVVIGTVFAFIAIVGWRSSPSRGMALRLGAVGDLTEKIRRALFDVVGAQFIGGGRASLNFASIAAGLQERLTITVTGALLGDFAQAACETDIEAGLAFTAHVSAADTVTVTLVNNTAGAIDAAANVFRVRVTRESRR